MQNRLARILVVILLTVSVGGHWAVLQSLAWVTMVIDYSKDAPIAVAMEKTFDGKHPCNICKLVKSGKETEQKRDSSKLKVKSDAWLFSTATNFDLQSMPRQIFSSSENPFSTRGDSPPVPPPRFA